jgi:ABC-2 type transport system permease protein
VSRPGSILWLLRHELRVGWRRMDRRDGRPRAIWIRLVFLFGLPLVITAAFGPPLARYLSHHDLSVMPEAAAVAVAGIAAMFTIMLSQTVSLAVDALYQRGDLDLLFSSPLDPRRILTIRFLAVAVDSITTFGYFLAGPALLVAVLGHIEGATALVILVALAFAASGSGFLLASGFLRLFGPRRTRTAVQILSALLGAAFFLASQFQALFSGERAQSGMALAAHWAREARRTIPALDWPLRALLGEPLPMLAVLAAGGAVFWLSVAVLGPRFAADAAAAAGAGAGQRRAEATMAAFASGPFRATLRKELRLLARDPGLITQVLVRVLYLAPVGLLLLKQASEGQSLLLPGTAAALSFVTGQIAASLAWITVSAEDAPDLLVSAPAPVSEVREAKVTAAVLPTAAVAGLFLAPLLFVAPVVGVAATAGCAASATASSLINVWWQQPARRAEFRNRRRAAWFVTVAEIAIGMSIALATGLFAAAQLWGLIPTAVAAIIFLSLRRSDARIAEALRAAS